MVHARPNVGDSTVDLNPSAKPVAQLRGHGRRRFQLDARVSTVGNGYDGQDRGKHADHSMQAQFRILLDRQDLGRRYTSHSHEQRERADEIFHSVLRTSHRVDWERTPWGGAAPRPTACRAC